MPRARFLLRQLAYDLRASLLVRPLLLTAALAALAPLLTELELHVPALARLGGQLPWLGWADAGAAQVVLGTIAGSMMTVLSITYSGLLMSLSVASTQFSPRILFGFMRDSTSQVTLGVFIGTFLYCLLLLRLVHGGEQPRVPLLAMAVAIGLALASLAWLLFFIHHMSQRIQANFLVDAVAGDTEEVLDGELGAAAGDSVEPAPREPVAAAPVVPALRSGYVQLLDREGLAELARARRLHITVHRGAGEFVIAGDALLSLAPGEALAPPLARALAGCVDLGPIRTMQQDAEFGVRQIVDIGLKAISPAVNDPSTAVTCIDHLGRLLCRAARRPDPPQRLEPAPGAAVHLRRPTFRRLLDLGCNQIRQYGKRDMAIALRLARTLGDIAAAALPAHRGDLGRHLDLLARDVRASVDAAELEEFEARLAAARAALASAQVA